MIGEYAEDENDCNPHRYAGEYWDKETEYIYLRARYYDPEISRFLNVDPIKDGMNWYGYTGGNPVMYTDPSGLRSVDVRPIDASKSAKAVKPPGWNNTSRNHEEAEIKRGLKGDAGVAIWASPVLKIPYGELLYGIIVGTAAAIEYGPSIVNTVGTYGSAAEEIIGNFGVEVSEGVQYGINIYDPTIWDKSMELAKEYTTLTNNPSALWEASEISTTEEALGDIMGRYGNLKCKEAAKEAEKILTLRGEKFEIITISYTGPGFIYSNLYDSQISQNGTHVGVLYNGEVHCNVHPYGLPLKLWLNDFEAFGVRTVMPPQYDI